MEPGSRVRVKGGIGYYEGMEGVIEAYCNEGFAVKLPFGQSLYFEEEELEELPNEPDLRPT